MRPACTSLSRTDAAAVSSNQPHVKPAFPLSTPKCVPTRCLIPSPQVFFNTLGGGHYSISPTGYGYAPSILLLRGRERVERTARPQPRSAFAKGLQARALARSAGTSCSRPKTQKSAAVWKRGIKFSPPDSAAGVFPERLHPVRA